MKYKFNKIFPLLIKLEENAGKLHFVPDLGLLGPNLGHNFFFFDVSALLDLRLSQAAIVCNIKEN